jgi:hypothetical protein
MKKYNKTSVRLSVKFVKESTNEIILTMPSDTMEVYQYFQNDFVDQIMRQTFGAKVETIGNILIVVDQSFVLK